MKLMNEVIKTARAGITKMEENQRVLEKQGNYIEAASLAIEIIQARKWVDDLETV